MTCITQVGRALGRRHHSVQSSSAIALQAAYLVVKYPRTPSADKLHHGIVGREGEQRRLACIHKIIYIYVLSYVMKLYTKAAARTNIQTRSGHKVTQSAATSVAAYTQQGYP